MNFQILRKVLELLNSSNTTLFMSIRVLHNVMELRNKAKTILQIIKDEQTATKMNLFEYVSIVTNGNGRTNPTIIRIGELQCNNKIKNCHLTFPHILAYRNISFLNKINSYDVRS